MASDPLVEKVAAAMYEAIGGEGATWDGAARGYRDMTRTEARAAIAVIREHLATELRDNADRFRRDVDPDRLDRANAAAAAWYIDGIHDAAAMASGQGPDWPYVKDSWGGDDD